MCQQNPTWKKTFSKTFQKLVDTNINSMIKSFFGDNKLNQGYLPFFEGFQKSITYIKKNKKAYAPFKKTLNQFRDLYAKAYLAGKFDSEYCDCVTFLNTNKVEDANYKALLTQRMKTMTSFCADSCNIKQVHLGTTVKKTKKIIKKHHKKAKKVVKKHHKNAKKHIKVTKKKFIRVKLSDYPKKKEKLERYQKKLQRNTKKL